MLALGRNRLTADVCRIDVLYKFSLFIYLKILLISILFFFRNLEDQIETIRKELTEHKLNNAKLTTQLDYSLESSKVIEKNVVAYKQEINSLRTKSEQYSNLVAKVYLIAKAQ